MNIFFFMKSLRLGVFGFLGIIFQSQIIYCQEKEGLHFSDALSSKPFSKIERFQIDKFISFLIYESHFGYVITGEKPLALESIPKHTHVTDQWYQSISTFKHMLKLFNIDQGREVFIKIQPKETTELFFFEEHRDKETDVFLLNKKTFQKAIEKNLSLFNSFLGIRISAEELLDRYIEDPNFRKKLHKSPSLLGILLGYGEKNSLLYQSLLKVQKNHLLKMEVKILKIKRLKCLPCVDHSTSIACTPPIPLPGFTGDPQSFESQKIISRFKKARPKILSENISSPIFSQ